MSIIKIEKFKNTKPDLTIEYDNIVAVLPASVPAAVFEAIISTPKPTNSTDAALQTYNEEVGFNFLAAFIKYVLPTELKGIPMEDMTAISEAWYEYVNLGEDSASTK